ncbi:MAG: hypothetical protein IT375_08795 [Polyangiaceae bacterium]|nr:hypothetical protein [Polyangiaceae bacterium]
MRLSTSILLIATACAGAPPSSPAIEPATPTAPPSATDAGVDAATDAAPAPLDASTDALPEADATPPALAAEGSPCNSAGECESGICEGEGCDDSSGQCASKERSCGAKLGWYCGCDGTDFQARDGCPGQRFAYGARCGLAKTWGRGAAPDGAPCLRASQCKSGVCEGPGCDDAHPGTCQPAMRGCGQSAVQYCGCDGRLFSSNPCPGVRFAMAGQCPIDPSVVSVVKVVSVTGTTPKVNDEVKHALLTNVLLPRCHRSSGEKTVAVTLQLEIDAQGRITVKKISGAGGPEAMLPRCFARFARQAVVAAAVGAPRAAQVSVKLRFDLTGSKP